MPQEHLTVVTGPRAWKKFVHCCAGHHDMERLMFTNDCCTKRSYFSEIALGAIAANSDGVARSMQPSAGQRTKMHCAPSSAVGRKGYVTGKKEHKHTRGATWRKRERKDSNPQPRHGNSGAQ